MNVSIAGLRKPAVLAALFNASRQQGMGFMDGRGASDITEDRAAQVIAEQGMYFDYLFGRVMKVDISGDELQTRWFDRDNGEGAAERAINALLERLTSPA